MEKVLEIGPDLVLTDILKLQVDGYEAIINIKRHPLLQRVSVIFLTARALEEDGGRSLAGGGLIFLRKLFAASQIRDFANPVPATKGRCSNTSCKDR